MNKIQIIKHKKYNTKWTEKNYNPSLVTHYDIRPKNGVGLLSKEKIKGK